MNIESEDKQIYTSIINAAAQCSYQDEAIERIIKIGAPVLIEKIVKKAVSNIHKSSFKIKLAGLEVLTMYYIACFFPQSQVDQYTASIIQQLIFEIDPLL